MRQRLPDFSTRHGSRLSIMREGITFALDLAPFFRYPIAFASFPQNYCSMLCPSNCATLQCVVFLPGHWKRRKFLRICTVWGLRHSTALVAFPSFIGRRAFGSDQFESEK